MSRQSERERNRQYDKLHRSPEIRAQLIKLLETMLEQYPMLRLGQILGNATRDLYYIEDDQLLRDLSQLQITYQQFQAAGIKKEQL